MSRPISVWRYFKELMQPYPWAIVGLGVTTLAWAIQFSAMPYVLKQILDQVNQVNSLTIAHLWHPCWLYISLFFLGGLIFRARDALLAYLFPNLIRDSTQQFHDYLSRHAYAYLMSHQSGNLSHKMSHASNAMLRIIDQVLELLSNALALVVALGVMASVHWVFALLLALGTVIFVAVTYWRMRFINVTASQLADMRASVFGRITDVLSQILLVRLSACHAHESRLLAHDLAGVVTQDRSLQKQLITMRLAQDVTASVMSAAMVAALVTLYQHDQATVGDFALILMLSLSILQCIWFLVARFLDFSEQLGKLSQGLAILNQPLDVVDQADAQSVSGGGEIVFDRIGFSYHQSQSLFQDLSFVIPVGQRLGLVGYSGSGKTSLIHLLLRLYDVQQGRILVNGIPLTQLRQDEWRQQVAVVSQVIDLFHRSIWDNLCYGCPHADEASVLKASKAAFCHDFIMQLPDGYQTCVGERGVYLSAGQRQRIAIARAFLKDAPILILDEATSALDAITEQVIKKSLAQLMANRTVIVIAHRLSTLQAMDRILVLDRGTIVQDGCHEDLIAESGLYAELWAHMPRSRA